MADAHERDLREPVKMELANAMVRIYKAYFGRGPTKSRADFAGSDILVCTLEDGLTPGDRSLAAIGEHQRLREVHLLFQHASKRSFCESVERITGRTVRGFVSGLDTEQEISTEVFYLEPRAAAQPVHLVR